MRFLQRQFKTPDDHTLGLELVFAQRRGQILKTRQSRAASCVAAGRIRLHPKYPRAYSRKYDSLCALNQVPVAKTQFQRAIEWLFKQPTSQKSILRPEAIASNDLAGSILEIH